jgi:hypothetical protein
MTLSLRTPCGHCALLTLKLLRREIIETYANPKDSFIKS